MNKKELNELAKELVPLVAKEILTPAYYTGLMIGQASLKKADVIIMEGYQKRVIKEKEEIEEKRVKLYEFMVDKKFNKLGDENKYLLFRQGRIMLEYSDILQKRIDLFEE